ncbi:MAG: hypothetical protein ACR2J4_05985, partial [Deinococcus sp.]
MEGDLTTPSRYWFGQDLNWEAAKEDVTLFMELPFWLMVPNCTQVVEVDGKNFKIDIKDDYVELYTNSLHDSKDNCIYIGPPSTANLSQDIQRAIEEKQLILTTRKCKTYLKLYSSCNKNVIDLFGQDKR